MTWYLLVILISVFTKHLCRAYRLTLIDVLEDTVTYYSLVTHELVIKLEVIGSTNNSNMLQTGEVKLVTELCSPS